MVYFHQVDFQRFYCLVRQYRLAGITKCAMLGKVEMAVNLDGGLLLPDMKRNRHGWPLWVGRGCWQGWYLCGMVIVCIGAAINQPYRYQTLHMLAGLQIMLSIE